MKEIQDTLILDKKTIHNLSLIAGSHYAECYSKGSDFFDETDKALELYMELRRLLPKETEGKRYGSYVAYCATQGFDDLRGLLAHEVIG